MKRESLTNPDMDLFILHASRLRQTFLLWSCWVCIFKEGAFKERDGTLEIAVVSIRSCLVW